MGGVEEAAEGVTASAGGAGTKPDMTVAAAMLEMMNFFIFLIKLLSRAIEAC
jgi:hypothetical protein